VPASRGVAPRRRESLFAGRWEEAPSKRGDAMRRRCGGFSSTAGPSPGASGDEGDQECCHAGSEARRCCRAGEGGRQRLSAMGSVLQSAGCKALAIKNTVLLAGAIKSSSRRALLALSWVFGAGHCRREAPQANRDVAWPRGSADLVLLRG